MEAVALIGRLDGVTEGELINQVNTILLDPLFPRANPAEQLSLSRRAFVTWIVLYVGAIVLYLTCASLDTLVLAVLRILRYRRNTVCKEGAVGATTASVRSLKSRREPSTHSSPSVYSLCAPEVDVGSEIRFSIASLALMTALTVPFEVGVQLGHSKVYHYASEYSMTYLILSPLLFVLVSDCAIYFIHRGLHHRSIYRYIHKSHHSYIHTTAFAAFAFHPLDGFLQGVSYQLFVYVFPFHSAIHLVSMACVLIWTINIHDRASFAIPGINGAAHHTIHHTTFKSNYGQYLTLWDRIFGTHRDPFAFQADGGKVLSEKEVYGKDA